MQRRWGGYGPYFDEMDRLKQWPGLTKSWGNRRLESNEPQITVRPTTASSKPGRFHQSTQSPHKG